MAELVDALDSGSSRGNSVDVRVILAAIVTQGGMPLAPDNSHFFKLKIFLLGSDLIRLAPVFYPCEQTAPIGSDCQTHRWFFLSA